MKFKSCLRENLALDKQQFPQGQRVYIV